MISASKVWFILPLGFALTGCYEALDSGFEAAPGPQPDVITDWLEDLTVPIVGTVVATTPCGQIGNRDDAVKVLDRVTINVTWSASSGIAQGDHDFLVDRESMPPEDLVYGSATYTISDGADGATCDVVGLDYLDGVIAANEVEADRSRQDATDQLTSTFEANGSPEPSEVDLDSLR